MTRCPSCGRTYAAAARFCADDGTPLVAITPVDAPPPPPRRAAGDVLTDLLGDEPEPRPDPARPVQETGPVRPRPGGAPPTRVAGGAYAPPTPRAPLPPAAPPQRPPSRGPWIAAAVLGALAVGAAVWFVRGNDARAMEREGIDAVARGDLVSPARVSAYDYYLRLADAEPASAERVGSAAFPALVDALDALFERFALTGAASDAEWDRAARLSEWTLRLAPDAPQVVARRAYVEARIAARDGDDAATRRSYEHAVAAWPGWALPHNSLGVLAAREGRTADAARHYEAAARLDAGWSFPLANLGGLRARQGRHAGAADAYRQAIDREPRRATLHEALARAYAAQGALREALVAAEAALQIDPAGETGIDAARLRADAETWAARLAAAAAPPPADDEALEEIFEAEPVDM